MQRPTYGTSLGNYYVYEKRPCQPYSTRNFTCALVTLPDQWLWSLVWERDYVCACIQHLKMASYAMDSNWAELRTALSIRVKLRVVMALSTWTVFEISMLNFVVLTRRRKMTLVQPHTFAFNCLPCGFWALVSLADHKETQRKNKHLNKPLSYLWWNYTTFP